MKVSQKYELYEYAVQSPEHHAAEFVELYKDLLGKYPVQLREDFCGTFKMSTEWVKRNRNNRAICLDLDPEPLAYGKTVNLAELNKEQKSRIKVLRQNVISVTKPLADLVIACNFSFCIFRERRQLLNYFQCVRKSLKPDGIFLLDLAGGPGMIEKGRERKVLRKNGKPYVTYIWDQQSFDPIQREAHYAIHFRTPNGRRYNNVFRYHWRLWTIPELRDIMSDAGFKETHVYWDGDKGKGIGGGNYIRTEKGENYHTWLAYIVGTKTKTKASKK